MFVAKFGRYDRRMKDDDEADSGLHRLVLALSAPGVTISSKAMMSFRVKYLEIARSASESLSILEQQGCQSARWFDEAFMRASVAYLMSCMAVEACANEALTDIGVPRALHAPIEKLSPIEKMEALSAFRGVDCLRRGERTAERLKLLVALRNGLAHPKAEWSDDNLSHAALSRKIRQERIARSPFAGAEDPDFPIACMSAGGAHWAVKTASDAIEEFRYALNLQ